MKILVLCTGNSCRSQMAEGFFKHFWQPKSQTNKSDLVDNGNLVDKGYLVDRGYIVASAGLETHGLNPLAVRVMSEIGIDISSQTSDNLKQYLGDSFDYVITVCDNAAENCPVFLGQGTRLHWPFDDPARATGSEEEILDEFRRVRDEIGAQVKNWLDGFQRP